MTELGLFENVDLRNVEFVQNTFVLNYNFVVSILLHRNCSVVIFNPFIFLKP